MRTASRCLAVGTAMGLLLFAAPARAQIAQAEVRGAILDESGAGLPGVSVTAMQVETGVARTVSTAVTGTYNMPALPIGLYEIKAELQGFTTVIRQDLRLLVGQILVIDFTLKVAAVAETITVTGEASLVDVKSTDLAGQVDQNQVQNLPLNGRNWLSLVSLVPGARGTPGQVQAGASGQDMVKHQIDGVDISGQCCGGANQTYSTENIAEFQVVTNRHDAEYGRVGGVVVNAVTKSGTNQFRGTGFSFLRDDRFDARNFFTGVVAPFHELQSGVNGGGPIVRDRLQFFASFEHQGRDITARPNTGFSQFDNDVPQDVTRDLYTLRIDTQLSPKHRLFGRTSRDDSEQVNVGVGGMGGRVTLSGGYGRPSVNTDLSIGETWIISDRMVHEVRVGVSHINNELISNSETPRLTFPSVILGSPTNSPQSWQETNIMANNSLSYFLPGWHGDHAMKMGFQFFRPKFWGELPNAKFGSYTFSTDPANINDASTYPRPTQYVTSLGDFSYSVTNPVYAAFFQDTWTVTPRLTWNLGVRYDLESGVKNTDLPPNPIEPGDRKSDIDNVSPRLGFAYDFRGDGRTIVRGGYGRYYDKVLLNITSNERRIATGQFIQVTIQNPTFVDPLQGRTYEDFRSQGIPRDTVFIANDYRTPRQDQISIGIARVIGASHSVEADFVHSKGVNEPRGRNVNLFEDPDTHLPRNPSTFGRPYPQFLNAIRYETSAKSKYDGLQMGFKGRKSGEGWLRQYQYQGSYTLSWTYDDHNDNRFSTVTNPFNLADEYSFSSSDQRHRFTVNTVLVLPWDFNVGAFYFLGSERTIEIQSTLNPFGSGTGRWMDATGRTLPRFGERTEKWDKKLDLRISKTVRVRGVRLEGVVDAFNVFNTKNLTNYGTNFGSATYLQPSSPGQTTTGLFYQPRQVQLGFRVSY